VAEAGALLKPKQNANSEQEAKKVNRFVFVIARFTTLNEEKIQFEDSSAKAERALHHTEVTPRGGRARPNRPG
jgi:hypothetical protein